MSPASVLILGGGIQGICCALELHRAGHRVVILEQADEVFSRTSLHQEGRVHIGFTYGLDRTGRTGVEMVKSALSFSTLMERWLGPVDWRALTVPSLGYYLVHRTGSLLDQGEILAYFEFIQDTYTARCADHPSLTYLGERPERLFRALREPPADIRMDHVSLVLETEERILEVFRFRDLLMDALDATTIERRTGTEVTRLERRGDRVVVHGRAEDRPVTYEADLAVNCLWNDRIRIDRSLGAPTLANPLYRFKVGLYGRVPTPVLNCTIIAGGFGNISPRMDGEDAYISWHRSCMRGMTTDGTTPEAWTRGLQTGMDDELTSAWVREAIDAMAAFLPAASGFMPTRLLPGIICSTGRTDIHDKHSEVHQRAQQMGVFQHGPYISVNTGKFSSAPMNALRVGEVVAAGGS